MYSVNSYYCIDVGNQVISCENQKPGYGAEEAISRIQTLVDGVVNRRNTSLRAPSSTNELTPGYARIVLPTSSSGMVNVPFDQRAKYNLLSKEKEINEIVKKIIEKYEKSYEANTWFVMKVLHSWVLYLGGSTPLSRMREMQTHIADQIKVAGAKASNYINLIYGV